jgi:rRNA maturation RNase YbeY
MIEICYESEFRIPEEGKYTEWFINVIESEGSIAGDLCFIVSTDTKVLEINEKYLGHTDFTDVITFDYSSGKTISGDIYMSMDRILDNATKYKANTDEELRRVMVHGLLHLMGYTDKTEKEKSAMRIKEDEKLQMFHVEQ